MREVCVKELTWDEFHFYGSFCSMINPKAPCIGAPPIEFFRDLLQLNPGAAGGPSFSVCRVSERPGIVDVTEMHTACSEGILPLDGDVLIHVGLATPDDVVSVDSFEVFRVPTGTFVSLRPGVWHHAPFTCSDKAVNVLIVLPERTYANDCQVHEIPEKNRIRIT